MKPVRRYCIIISAALLLCGCESKDKPAIEQCETNAPVVTIETNTPQKPIDPVLKKVKPATQSFFEAALNGDIQTVQSELIAGVDVNAASLNGQNQTALMLAAYNGHKKLVEMLIVHGGNVNAKDATNRTALMYCCSGPFPETTQILLDKGAEVNIIDNNERWTALMFAAAEGHLENVKLLLGQGADYKLKDTDGDTAASFAVNNGHSQVAKMIEEHAQSNP